MAQELGLMSQKEVHRFEVINRVTGGDLDQGQAAQLLGLSVRQVKRLCRSVRQRGAQGLISRKRGQPSNRRISLERREHFVQVVRSQYADFGPQFAHEHLEREHGFEWSVETLRGWMLQAGLWQAKQRRAKRVHNPRAGASAWASWCRSMAATTTGSKVAPANAA